MSSRIIPILIIIGMLLLAGCAGVMPTDDQPPEEDSPQQAPNTNTTETNDTDSADTDGDGIKDSVEINKYNTNPQKADTDGDGLDDSREIDLGTDPTKVDTDDDGVNDSKEIDLPTDPTKADTDSDGLNDGREIKLGTDPTKADTDSDGLNDGREIELGTDPTILDTDGDSLPDGFEVKMGGAYADADPLHKDVFVQVDYVEQLDTQKKSTIKEEFTSAPISNPDGQDGINLHIDYSGELTCEPGPSANTDGIGSRIEYPCETDTGNTSSENLPAHYYVRIVEEVNAENKYVDKIGGVVLNGQTAFVSSNDPYTPSVFMHEFGHLLNLNHPQDPDEHRSFSEYRSVMTYNAPDGTLQFAEEDWETIKQSIQFTPKEYISQRDLVSKVD